MDNERLLEWFRSQQVDLNDDKLISCVLCGETKCEFYFVTRGGGMTCTNGIHAACRASRGVPLSAHIILWEETKKLVADAEKSSEEAREQLRVFELKHWANKPLTAFEQLALRAVVTAGWPLCCAEGKKVLAEIVDPIWAERINAWAYEVMTCGKAIDHEYNLKKLDAWLDERKTKP